MTAFPKHEADAPKACRVPSNPRGGREEASLDPGQPQIRILRKMIKGWLASVPPLSPDRAHAEAIDTSTSHLGFRCVIREPAPDSLLSS
ncbi:MAG TPA: hypothetical protein VGL24_13930 [Chthoniobacterales bacterium]